MKKKVISIILTLTMLLGIAIVLPLSTGAVDVWDGTSSMPFTGTGTESSPYIITSGANLKYLQAQVDSGTNYEGKYIVLADDIDLGGHEWTPIGSARSTNAFAGNFNGQGYTVKGLSITTNSQQYLGLFGVLGVGANGTTTSDAVIKNLTVEGEINLDLDDITVALDIGGLVGFTEGKSADYKAKIENCISKVNVTFDLDKLSKAIFTGGIGGRIFTYADVTDCATYGNIDVTVRGTKNQPRVGGLAGGTTNFCNFTRVVNYGNVKSDTDLTQSNTFVGGLIGARASTAGAVNLEYCANFGSVTAINRDNQHTAAGGLVGSLQISDTAFNNCYNSGAVHAEIAYSEGAISDVTAAGGIVGYVYSVSTNSIIQNSYNSGNITVSGGSGGEYAGGIVGEGVASEGSKIENCKTTTAAIIDVSQTIDVISCFAGISLTDFDILVEPIKSALELSGIYNPPDTTEETTVEETTVEETTVDETTVDETTVDETTVDETTVKEETTVKDNSTTKAQSTTETPNNSGCSCSGSGTLIPIFLVVIGGFVFVFTKKRF